MLQEGQTRGPGQATGYVWESGEPFYGTRVGPGWYQGGAGLARGCKVPFSVLRMLMQASRKLRPMSTLVRPAGQVQALSRTKRLADVSQAPHITGMSEKLEMRIYGDRSLPTLIYLPGLHGDWTLVGSFRRALAGRVRFVEVTYPRTLDWSLDDYARGVETALAEQGIARGWLLGESFGFTSRVEPGGEEAVPD